VASSIPNLLLTCRSDALKGVQPRHLVIRLLASWHLVSLDAPSVAIVWAYAIASSVHVHLESWIVLLLACGTWTVYVFDRILDAGRAINTQAHAALRERHYFHWRHRRVLISLATCTGLLAAAVIIGLMPAVARERDSIIAAAALAYFSGVHSSAQFPRWLRRLCSKEMLVGILFATGCAAPTLTRLHSASPWPVLLGFAFLASVAWLNCVAISCWESHLNSIDISAIAVTIALIGFAVAIVLAPSLAGTSALFGCAAISAIMIAGLHRLRGHLDPVTLRAMADLVLLTPAILLIPRVFPA
jgi:hypothetical protein